MLPLMECFFSVQGEGRRVGYNSLFIRLGGCNFRCAGFKVSYDVNGEKRYGCDSWYSVDPAFRKTWDIKTTFDEIVDEANKVCPAPIPNRNDAYDVVITGGEPTMYWNNPEFQKLLMYYTSRGHKVTIETNASLDLEFTKPYQKDLMFSMSVKLSNSGEPEHKRINIDSITNILENSSESYLKFVISKETVDESITEIEDILNSIPYYTDVYLMPMGSTNKELNKNREAVAQLCIDKNFMYSDRAHIAIWNDKPGV